MPSSVATASAQTPWCDCGCLARSRKLPVSIINGPSPRRSAIDIFSVPPPITRSSVPDMTEAAAKFTEVMPEPQKRSSVTPLALTS
jgi:hypothetical protein